MIRNLIFALTTVAAVSVMAQTTPTHTPPTPEQRIAKRIEYLTALLTLLPTQVTQITTILTDESSQASPVETSLRQARTDLRTAINGLAADAVTAPLATKIGQLSGQLEAIHASSQVKFRSVLTADQRTKLDTLAPGMGGHGGPGGPGGAGPGGPDRRGAPHWANQ
jgi:Spy/CpxP family protein refolding chaperone